jgi:hypothetical protein
MEWNFVDAVLWILTFIFAGGAGGLAACEVIRRRLYK